jgi:hypothetical protein
MIRIRSTEARRVRCRLTKQPVANELVFQALKNGDLHFTVEQRSCIAKELALSPQTSEQLDNDACQLRADFDSVAGRPDTVEYALHPGVASDPSFFEDGADRHSEQQIGDRRVGILTVAGEALDEVPEIVARRRSASR